MSEDEVRSGLLRGDISVCIGLSMLKSAPLGLLSLEGMVALRLPSLSTAEPALVS